MQNEEELVMYTVPNLLKIDHGNRYASIPETPAPPLMSKVYYEYYQKIWEDMAEKILLTTDNPKQSMEAFLNMANKKYKFRYIYDEVNFNDVYDNVSFFVTCKLCGYRELTNRTKHLNNEKGCMGCSDEPRGGSWNKSLIEAKGRRKYGERYSYDLIPPFGPYPKSSAGGTPHVPIHCRLCTTDFKVEIHKLLGKDYIGCPGCCDKKYESRSYQSFWIIATRIHGGKFLYPLWPRDKIIGFETMIPYTCRECGTTAEISAHIHLFRSRQTCKFCLGRDDWTFEKFTRLVVPALSDTHNFELVKPEDIVNGESKIKVIHKPCGTINTVGLYYFYYNGLKAAGSPKAGCTKCGLINWCPQFVHEELERYFPGKYRFIQESETLDCNTRLKIYCIACNDVFMTNVKNLFHSGCGCPGCFMSKGELMCERALKELRLPYVKQWRLPTNTKRRYDFHFSCYHGPYLVNYIIEIDGRQHFDKIERYHPTDEIYKYKRLVDIEKTQDAIRCGYKIIRIDYLQFKFIRHNIIEAIKSPSYLYVSNVEMYDWIIKGISGHRVETQLEDDGDLSEEEDGEDETTE